MGRGDSSDRTNRTPNVWRLEVALGEAAGPHVLSPLGVCLKLPGRREQPEAIAPSFQPPGFLPSQPLRSRQSPGLKFCPSQTSQGCERAGQEGVCWG